VKRIRLRLIERQYTHQAGDHPRGARRGRSVVLWLAIRTIRKGRFSTAGFPLTIGLTFWATQPQRPVPTGIASDDKRRKLSPLDKFGEQQIALADEGDNGIVRHQFCAAASQPGIASRRGSGSFPNPGLAQEGMCLVAGRGDGSQEICLAPAATIEVGGKSGCRLFASIHVLSEAQRVAS